MIPIIQSPSLILPAGWVNPDTDTETIADLLEHTSREPYVADQQDFTASIIAIETVGAAGAPGPLSIWVELSPVDSGVSAAYWAAIGGGGGALPPIAPLVIAGLGVNGTVHTEFIAWNVHSAYIRIVAQTPVNANLPGSFWQVRIVLSGKTG